MARRGIRIHWRQGSWTIHVDLLQPFRGNFGAALRVPRWRSASFNALRLSDAWTSLEGTEPRGLGPEHQTPGRSCTRGSISIEIIAMLESHSQWTMFTDYRRIVGSSVVSPVVLLSGVTRLAGEQLFPLSDEPHSTCRKSTKDGMTVRNPSMKCRNAVKHAIDLARRCPLLMRCRTRSTPARYLHVQILGQLFFHSCLPLAHCSGRHVN